MLERIISPPLCKRYDLLILLSVVLSGLFLALSSSCMLDLLFGIIPVSRYSRFGFDKERIKH